MSEALRLADALERDYYDETLAPRKAAAELRRLVAENEGLRGELAEQARVNGMGGEREARLLALNAELVEALREICETDPVDRVLDPHRAMRIARSALAKVEVSK